MQLASTVRLIRATDGFYRLGKGIKPGTPLFFNASGDSIWEPTKWAIEHFTGTGNTINTYAAKVRGFLDYCYKFELDWKGVSFADFIGLRRILDDREVSPATNNAYFDALYNFYDWCRSSKITRTNPLPESGRRLRRNLLWRALEDREIRYIPPEHTAAILEHLTPKYRLAAQLSVATGLRECELASLEWNWLPSPEKTIGRLEVAVLHHKRKGERKREFFLPVSLYDKLWDFISIDRALIVDERSRMGAYREPSNVFLTNNGQRIRPSRFSKVFHRAVLDAGLGDHDYSMHGLRHTFAVLTLAILTVINKDAGELYIAHELARRLGHISLESAQTYIAAIRKWPIERTRRLIELAKQAHPVPEITADDISF